MATGQHLLSQQQHPIADPRLYNVRLILLQQLGVRLAKRILV